MDQVNKELHALRKPALIDLRVFGRRVQSGFVVLENRISGHATRKSIDYASEPLVQACHMLQAFHISHSLCIFQQPGCKSSTSKHGMTKTTSPYLDFARNLRTMTDRKGTIAQVCRELGMNRQQFNKYLSGTSLPSPQTLEKIAHYFGVDQHAMFDRNDDPKAKSWTEGTHPLFILGQLDNRVLKSFVGTLSHSSKTQLREGCYLVYYPWLRDPSKIVRAVMVVYRVGNVLCFRRFTRFAMKGQPWSQGPRGQHEGMIFEKDGRTFLIANNIQGFTELSLQSFGASNTSDFGTMSGLAVVMTPWAEPLATRVTIEYFGPKDAFRSALRRRGLVSSDSPEVSETVKMSILEPVSFPTAQLIPFQMFDAGHA